MKSAFYVSVIFAIATLGGCASEVKYKKDADQYKAGLELVQNEIPKQKAILEFTTNTDIPATLTEQGGDNLCKPDQKKFIARVQRQQEISKLEDSVASIMNVASLGLVKALGDPRDNKTPVVHYSYIDADKELILQASSYAMRQSAGGWISHSCGPLFMKFTPREGKRYKIAFTTLGDKCTSSLTEIEDSAEIIPRHTLWSCTKPVMGLGGDEVIGLTEIKGR